MLLRFFLQRDAEQSDVPSARGMKIGRVPELAKGDGL